MSQQTAQESISRKRIVYTHPGMDGVTVRRDLPYAVSGSGLTMDLYYTAQVTPETRTPAVVFVTGFPDAGAQRMYGCRMKEMGSYVSWGQLTAATGLVAVTYANEDPARDVHTVIEHVSANAADLGIDESRMGVWSCSGNVPNALAVLSSTAGRHFKCGVLPYGYLFDIDGLTHVANASRRFGFANPAAAKTVDDLPADVPLLLARAGLDQMPGLNDTLDRCVGRALARNLPISVVNHARGPHAFDLFDDSATSREIVREMLAFLKFHLL